MKPPWKFLAQLMSRQRPSETPAQTRERGSDRKPVEIELKPPATPLLAAPEVAPGEQDHESPSPDPVKALAATASEVDALAPASPAADGKGQGTGAIDEREQAVTDVTGLAPAKGPTEPSSMPQETSPKVARKARVHRTAKRPLAVGKEPAPQSPLVPANPLFDEAASLDEDIKQLKDQLAQKLRLQNAQLRKMLERFERS